VFVAMVQSKGHAVIHFTSISAVGIINEENPLPSLKIGKEEIPAVSHLCSRLSRTFIFYFIQESALL